MQNLTLRYTTWINRKYFRTGHVFQGRYKALLIDADSYLLELVRYIHLNPVRAKIVNLPTDYFWSGHHAYLGKVSIPWLTIEWILSQFYDEISQARASYNEFILAGMNECRRPEFHSGSLEGRILGSDCFVDEVLQKAGQHQHKPQSLDNLVSAICRHFNLPIGELAARGKRKPHSEARSVAALFIRESADHSLTELGVILNRDIASLSQAARRLEDKMNVDPELARTISELKNRLVNL